MFCLVRFPKMKMSALVGITHDEISGLAARGCPAFTPELTDLVNSARDNGVTNDEISALITHCAFYGGFPAAISASMIAADTLL
jgi:alkylhydroperoxidase/carboxymuconolactone decarboxylase family protein YurZ